MYRFSHTELFRTNDDFESGVYILPADSGQFLIVDDFYADPMSVRRLLLTTPYPAWERDSSGAN